MSTVWVRGDEVGITAVVEDPVLAELMRAVPEYERPTLLADIIEIGARMARRQQEGEQADLLHREVDRMREQVESLLSGAGSGFAEAMRPVLESVAQQLASIGGRLDGVLAVSEAQVELEKERERGTAKGRSFEEEVAEKIDEIARHQGDTCEHVGDAWGIGGRAGDVVVGVDGAGGAERGRVVFEAKTGRLSRPEALRELDRAKEARGADYAVLVVAGNEKVPPGLFELREYGGDKLVIAYYDSSSAGIELAYSCARARVLASSVQGEGADVGAAKEAIEQAVQEFDRLRSIKLKMTSIATASTEAGAMVEDMVGVLRSKLERAAQALSQSA